MGALPISSKNQRKLKHKRHFTVSSQSNRLELIKIGLNMAWLLYHPNMGKPNHILEKKSHISGRSAGFFPCRRLEIIVFIIRQRH